MINDLLFYAMNKKSVLRAENRDVFGKKLNKMKAGEMLPAVLYGPSEKNRSLFVSLGEFTRVWKEAGESTLIELEVGGEKKNVLIYDVDLDPIKNKPRHIDFYAVDMSKILSTSVPLVIEGVASAVKNLGGILIKVMHEIEVEALPQDLPSEIKVDISILKKMGDKITAADLELPKGVKMLARAEDAVVLIEEMKEEVAGEETKTIADIEVVGAKEKQEEDKEKEEGVEEPEKKE